MSGFEGLEATCQNARLPFDGAWLPKLQHLALLLAAGQVRSNLVGDASAAGLLTHVLEALTVAALAEQVLESKPQHVVDIGSGAGLEAITLALVWPHARVVAVEPRKLRATFTAETAVAMGLSNLQVVAKSLHAAELPRQFQVATARAVWPVPDWPERARGVLSAQGVAAVHTHGPANTLAERIIAPRWQLVAAADVPGERPYAVALLRPL